MLNKGMRLWLVSRDNLDLTVQMGVGGPQADPSRRMGTHALGIPDTSLSGRSTRTALSVRRSNSVPTVAKMLQEKTTVRQESKGQR